MMHTKQANPCGDCVDGYCTMNCGPALPYVPEFCTRFRLPKGQCKTCDEHGDDQGMPYHDASPKCESGRHPHCTCDTCY